MPYTYATPGHHNQCPSLHLCQIVVQQLLHGRHLIVYSHFDKTDDGWVWQAMHKDQFAKILIFRYQHPSFLRCQIEQYFVGSPWVDIDG
jgi:hypothetical protein